MNKNQMQIWIDALKERLYLLLHFDNDILQISYDHNSFVSEE